MNREEINMLSILCTIKEYKENMSYVTNEELAKEIGQERLQKFYWENRRKLEECMKSLRLEDIKYIIILLELGQGGYITEASNEEIYKVLKEDMKKISRKEINQRIEDMVINSQLICRLEKGLDILADLEKNG